MEIKQESQVKKISSIADSMQLILKQMHDLTKKAQSDQPVDNVAEHDEQSRHLQDQKQKLVTLTAENKRLHDRLRQVQAVQETIDALIRDFKYLPNAMRRNQEIDTIADNVSSLLREAITGEADASLASEAQVVKATMQIDAPANEVTESTAEADVYVEAGK